MSSVTSPAAKAGNAPSPRRIPAFLRAWGPSPHAGRGKPAASRGLTTTAQFPARRLANGRDDAILAANSSKIRRDALHFPVAVAGRLEAAAAGDLFARSGLAALALGAPSCGLGEGVLRGRPK